MAEEVTDIGEMDDELLELIGSGPTPFPEKIERVFQPWHRPRKQYVRNLQWSKEISYLARDLKLRNGELRYLTLPGNDLLDIRHIITTVCVPKDVRLKYLGFNIAANPSDSGQSELNAAQFSINRLDCVNPESEVFPGDFRELGNDRSVSWERVRRAGSFHAINLDLCGGFAGKESPGIPNYFTALQVLLQNQSRFDDEFLLFITTRMDDDNVDSDTKETLNTVAQNIYDACQKYASAFAEAWDVADDGDAVRITNVAGTGEAFMLGLTQWIISQAVGVDLKASVKSFMTYRTGSGTGDDDIVSLAIRFKPLLLVRPDGYGLIKPGPKHLSRDERECDQSTAVPERVSNRVRVDDILREQADEFQRCLRESGDLLSDVGYDRNSYETWVMQEPDRYSKR